MWEATYPPRRWEYLKIEAAFQVESLSGLLHSRVHIELQSLVINTDSWQIFEVIWQLQLEEILIGRLAQ